MTTVGFQWWIFPENWEEWLTPLQRLPSGFGIPWKSTVNHLCEIVKAVKPNTGTSLGSRNVKFKPLLANICNVKLYFNISSSKLNGWNFTGGVGWGGGGGGGGVDQGFTSQYNAYVFGRIWNAVNSWWICFIDKTRITPRAQISAMHNFRSMMHSSQALNSFATPPHPTPNKMCLVSSATYQEQFMKILSYFFRDGYKMVLYPYGTFMNAHCYPLDNFRFIMKILCLWKSVYSFFCNVTNIHPFEKLKQTNKQINKPKTKKCRRWWG